jgi:hypothetical protein
MICAMVRYRESNGETRQCNVYFRFAGNSQYRMIVRITGIT